MKKVIACGPVIVENGKLLVTMDNKDPFYKIPGGKPERMETLDDCALREFEEETGLSCMLAEELSPMRLKKDPLTGESVDIRLYHYNAKLTKPVKNYENFKYNGNIVSWLDIGEIKKGKYPIAPNIKFLIEKGDISV